LIAFVFIALSKNWILGAIIFDAFAKRILLYRATMVVSDCDIFTILLVSFL
jgi:hypothetical protein